MRDAAVLALEEINERGGLLGRQIEWVSADGRSDWPTFAREAQRLVEHEKVSVIFGCWTSASRKSVKPVVEQNHHLLIYPMAYEGLEQSPNIIYTGAAPNQQVIPAVTWCYEALKKRKFFLVGSDYVWPHCVNEIIKDQLKALGAELAGEGYILFGSAEVEPVVKAIETANPDIVISTVVGDSNESFYQQLQAAGIAPNVCLCSLSALLKMSCVSFQCVPWWAITPPGTISKRLTGLKTVSSSAGSSAFLVPIALRVM